MLPETLYPIYQSEETDIMKTEPNRTPYNIRPVHEKAAPYRKMISPKLAKQLQQGIVSIIVNEKRYRDPHFSAQELAKELNTNTRYLSAVINDKFGMNFSVLVNKYRIRDAKKMLESKRYEQMTIADISYKVGFANRQSFYASFYRLIGITPRTYRKQKLEELNQAAQETEKQR